MSVETITAKILSDAKAEASRIDAEIAEKVKKIQAEQGAQIKAIDKKAQEEGQRRGEDRHKKDIATAELELRKSLLAQKQELIETVFDQAFKRLAGLRGEEYEQFIAGLLLKVVEVGDEEVVVSGKGSPKMGKKLLHEVNAQLAKAGKKGQLRMVEENRELQGGFVLRRGKMEVNCSLNSLFSTIREELEPRVAEILFS